MWSSEIFVGRYKVISSMQNAIYALEFHIKKICQELSRKAKIFVWNCFMSFDKRERGQLWTFFLPE